MNAATKNHFDLKLLAPDRSEIDAPAQSVCVPACEGDMTILPCHAPVVTSLRQGVINTILADKTQQSFSITGGFIDVDQTQCTILAEGLEALPNPHPQRSKQSAL